MKVSKEEFDKFIEEYPRELTVHWITICHPPVLGYYDFTLDCFSSMVASRRPKLNADHTESGEYDYYKLVEAGETKEVRTVHRKISHEPVEKWKCDPSKVKITIDGVEVTGFTDTDDTNKET